MDGNGAVVWVNQRLLSLLCGANGSRMRQGSSNDVAGLSNQQKRDDPPDSISNGETTPELGGVSVDICKITEESAQEVHRSAEQLKALSWKQDNRVSL